MRKFFEELKDFFKKGDMTLLILILIVAGFGCVCMASATMADKFGDSNLKYIVVQILAIGLGMVMYAIVSSLDVEVMSEHRYLLVGFNIFLLLLLIPFGTDAGTGNRSWLDFPILPFNIQPAEICKITYIIIMASVMASHQNNISKFGSVVEMVFHLGILVGLNMAISNDAGVSLIFVFIFIGMAFAGGVSIIWFLIAGGGIAVAAPILWQFLDSYQRLRIEVLFNPDLDPLGTGARYHTMRSIRSLTGGGMTGQGLFNGTRTQTEGALFAQHTDYIFSAIGEELGYVGCALVMLMMLVVIIRCIYVGTRSQDYIRRIVCFGAAAAMIFQVMSNIGMCIGITPVIGLTLPFISYGGSSIVTLYAMMGLVSGVYARPAPTSHERYIRPPYGTILPRR